MLAALIGVPPLAMALSFPREFHPLLAQLDVSRVHHLRDDVCSVAKV